MLSVLRISNLAIVDELEIEFSPGLNVLTGETGAGKSVVLKAIEFLIGKRVGADVIRSSAEKCEVEGLFLLSPEILALLRERLDEIDEILTEDELLLKRIIDRTGRSKFYFNGHLTTSAVLQSVAPLLVDITGQHQQQTLLDSSRHRELLDCFGVPKDLLVEVKERFLTLSEAERNLDRFVRDSGAREEYFRRISFERDELQEIALVEGERDEVTKELARLANVEQLHSLTAQSLELLEESEHDISSQLLTLRLALQNACKLDSALSAVLSLVESALANVSEVGLALRQYAGKLEANPERLDALRERIADILRVERKYRQAVPELLLYLKKIEDELTQWESGVLTEDQLRKKLNQAKGQLEESEERLHQERLKVAERLSRSVQQELTSLNMKHARFRVDVGEGISSLGGADKVEFLLAANPGEAFYSLSKVASGGELSRVLLILKTLLHEQTKSALQVFDEVDTGVGGAVAQVVGEKLKRIAKKNQVLLVTHAAQIAAFADRHLSISKITSKNSTKSLIQTLNFEERVQEIARMLAGKKVSSNFEDSARELLHELFGEAQ